MAGWSEQICRLCQQLARSPITQRCSSDFMRQRGIGETDRVFHPACFVSAKSVANAGAQLGDVTRDKKFKSDEKGVDCHPPAQDSGDMRSQAHAKT